MRAMGEDEAWLRRRQYSGHHKSPTWRQFLDTSLLCNLQSLYRPAAVHGGRTKSQSTASLRLSHSDFVRMIGKSS